MAIPLPPPPPKKKKKKKKNEEKKQTKKRYFIPVHCMGWQLWLYWAVQAGLLTPLTFARHRLSPLAAFTSGAYFLHNGRRWQWICEFYTTNLKGIFGTPVVTTVYRMPQNTFFPHEIVIIWSAKKWCKDTLFSTLHPPSPVIFATATVAAFVLLHNSRFNFHCYYTARSNAYSEIGPEVTLWPLATSCAKDYKGHSLVQSSFTEPPNTS